MGTLRAARPTAIRVQIGIDAGQLGDYSAIAVTERERQDDGLHHHVRRLERLPLGTTYPEVASRVVEMRDGLARRSRERVAAGEPGYRVLIALDVTGVGRGLYDVLRERGVRVVPVSITGADTLTERDGGEWSCGKSVLVANLLLGVQTGRLHLPDADESRVLIRELQDFRSETTRTGRTTYNAESGSHDDLITAIGLATLPGLQRSTPPPLKTMFATGTAKHPRPWR